MKEIYPLIQKFIEFLNYKQQYSSSYLTQVIICQLKENFIEKFKNFKENDIIISKQEYIELLYLKRDKIIDGKQKRFIRLMESSSFIKVIDLRSYDKQISEIEEKIEYLKLI